MDERYVFGAVLRDSRVFVVVVVVFLLLFFEIPHFHGSARRKDAIVVVLDAWWSPYVTNVPKGWAARKGYDCRARNDEGGLAIFLR